MLLKLPSREKTYFSIAWRSVAVLIVFALHQPAHAVSKQLPLVVVTTAQTDAVIRRVPLSGTVTSAKVARLSTEVSGQVETVKVEVGDRVAEGDILLQLDNEIEQLALQSSQAATAQAQAELADARRRYKDAEQLEKQNTISENAKRLLQAEVEIDRASLRRQQAEQRRQEARVKRHTLKAPFAGVISERLTEVGEWINTGTAVFTLIAVDDLRVDFRVPQEFYPRINGQSEVTVTLDAYPNREFKGNIKTVVPVNDPSARTFLIHVRLNELEVPITPGMSAHGLLRLNTGRRGIVISRDALLRYPDGRVSVWLVDQNQSQPTVTEQSVTVGLGFDGQVSILDGLKAGDVIVVEGNESLQEGQQVRIMGQPQ